MAKKIKEISNREIEGLRRAAGQHGDLAMVKICDRALSGSRKARQECAHVIAAANG